MSQAVQVNTCKAIGAAFSFTGRGQKPSLLCGLKLWIG